MNHKTIITELLRQGKLEEAIKALVAASLNSEQESLHTNLILLSSQYNNNKRDNNRGILSSDDYRQTRAKMSYALTVYLDEYQPKEDD